ncbi:UDP-3-O-(3-hydroxymyristoyl)glucosamine N-acyltransferase [Methylophilaceae bacterium]|nr:UDP-3-O-(3-hydroxymyristoyl)glucosamine N-acyltransferase [Methylophilaceae bacterium]
MPNASSKELANLLNGISTDHEVVVNNISSLISADSSSVSFYSDKKLKDQLMKCEAGLMILRKEDSNDWAGPSIFVENPYLAFAIAANFFKKRVDIVEEHHNTAIIGKNSKIEKNVYVGPYVVIKENINLGKFVTIEANSTIGANVIIGNGTKIHPQVNIGDNVIIGSNCEIFPGAAIGVDGFGYSQDKDSKWLKIPQMGSVIISDNVDIGSNSTIDRGALDNTIIKSGVKIDNQVQIGHNCIINQNTIIAGCVGIAGSAIIGKNCKIGGAAMILGHLSIADNTTISPGTMITKSIIKEGNKYTSITPFLEHKEWLRFAANIKKVDG